MGLAALKETGCRRSPTGVGLAPPKDRPAGPAEGRLYKSVPTRLRPDSGNTYESNVR
jgi:hypothetical protein